MRDIWLNIEHLVLESHSVEPRDAQYLARMTALALQRLLEQQGLPAGIDGCDVADIVAGDINLSFGASNEHRAQELALALYRALDRKR